MIKDCYNNGIVVGSGSNADIGGVCGGNRSGTIKDCYNNGSISGSGDYTRIGGVCGWNSETGTIGNSYNTGSVSGSGSNADIGGICGENSDNGTIESCSNTGSVTGNGSNADIGGICGQNYGTIENCYNNDSVSVSAEYDADIGGVCGLNYGTIKNCYNIGSVTGSGNYIGGVCGENIENGTIENCYYLDTCCADTSSYGTALTEAQMRYAENYYGFDFEVEWTIDPENEEYPYPTLTGVVHAVTCTVIFEDRDGTVISMQSVVQGGNAYAPYMANKTVVEDGYVYVFDHWDTDFNNVTNNITVKAVYTKTEIIRFLGSDVTINVDKGYSRDELTATIQAYFGRRLFTTTNGYKMMCEVIWNEDDMHNVLLQVPGVYTVNGIIKITDEDYSEFAKYYELSEGQTVTVTVNVLSDGEETNIFKEDDLEYTVNEDQTAVTITGYTGAAHEISIPEQINGITVTEIGDNAFYGNSELQIVKLPTTITKIGNSAFEACSSLVQIYLNNGLQVIGDMAFADTSLVCITLPETLTVIGEKAIAYYDGEKTIEGFVIYLPHGSIGIQYAENNAISYSLLEAQRDEASGIEASVEEGLTLAVAQVAEGEYFESAKDITQATENISLFEIKLEDSLDNEVQPGNLMTIAVPVPDTYDLENCRIYRINSDGTYTDMEAVLINGKLVFTAAYLSYYALVELGPVIYGDINGDKYIDSDDAIYMLYYLQDPENYPVNIDLHNGGDFNGDGEIDINDAIYLLYHVMLPERYSLIQ